MHHTKHPLDLIHSDVCGRMKTLTPGKNKYMVIFIDDYSRYTMCYLMQHKDEVADKYKEFVAEVSNKFQRKPKLSRSDNGGEYTGSKLINYLNQEGIRLQTSVPYSPSQNGVAERKNRSIVEMVKCMLLDAGLPLKYWGEAVMTAVYLSHIRIFGCKAFAYVPKEKRTEFDDRATEAVLVGYSERSKGYRLLQTDTCTNRIIISRSVTFDEKEPNDGMKVIQEMTNPNNTEKETQPTIDEDNEVEILVSTEDVDNQVVGDENCNDDMNVPLRRSTRNNKGIPPMKLSLMVQNELKKEPSSWK